ncbi:MAG: phage BR0599 family protein [Terriglobales bacterium]
MKQSIKNNPQLLAFLQSRVEFQRADLFVIQVANGQAITATDWQIDILNAGAPPQNYFASAFGRWKRGPITSEATFQPTDNEMELTVTIPHDATVNYPGTNVPLMQTVATGLFDKAQVWVYTAYAPLDPNVFNRHANGFDTSLGLEMKWMGDITGLKSLDRSKAVFSCHDLTYRLNQQTPQAIIQSPCLNTLFDAHCALNSALFSTGAQVAAGSTQLVLNTNIALPGIGANPLPYPLGVIRFTSGANLGLGAKIKAQNSTTQIVLDAPFIFPVNVGDQFIITPGCDQLQSTCSNTFGNLIHFRGFPFTPQPEVVL